MSMKPILHPHSLPAQIKQPSLPLFPLTHSLRATLKETNLSKQDYHEYLDEKYLHELLSNINHKDLINRLLLRSQNKEKNSD